MKKGKKILWIVIFLSIAVLVPYFSIVHIDYGPEYTLMHSITCNGDSYWYMVEYGLCPDRTLAFLLIQKAKNGSPISPHSRRYSGVNVLTGKVTTKVDFFVPDSIPLPNNEYIIYEVSTKRRRSGMTSNKITNKSKKKISEKTILSFFTVKRANYDLSELLRYASSQREHRK